MMIKDFIILQGDLTQVIIVEYGEDDEVIGDLSYNIHTDGQYEVVSIPDRKLDVWSEAEFHELPKQVKAAIIELVLGVEKTDALAMSEVIPLLKGGSDYKFWAFAQDERRNEDIFDELTTLYAAIKSCAATDRDLGRYVWLKYNLLNRGVSFRVENNYLEEL